ncbi:uncharacterized protein LOC110736230 isoform X1 [Chenopodium quinoa]|uniref:uncharacterized protein LOC110736230 isoform X1 n=2 Tax=Chenopodium quinoa TaxID=63459 RepID=UPI000B76D5C2|nr:uncharacterized protein LOC110736230 isoform X1 [Chenopodium quinoa]
MMSNEFSSGVPVPGMKIGGGARRFLFLLPVMIFLPYLLSVLELHKFSTSVDAPKKRGTKSDHLVLGPAAGQGLRNRLHCQGTRALNKTHHTVSQSSNSGENVAFVTVFTIYNSSEKNAETRSSDLVTIGNTSYTKLERSMAILDSFIDFIQVTMPLSNVIILTDPESDLRMDKQRVTTYPIQGEYSRDRLMLQRIRSYIAFLTTRLKELNSHVQGQMSHYIFTDSDIAVVDDLGQLFDTYSSFHLALTFRNNKDQPLNSGFIAVRGTAEGLQRAKEFLEEVLKAYTTRYMRASRMLGDQLALAWVVKSHPSFDSRRFSKPVPFSEELNGASILFLPCALYNWTPPEGAGQFHGLPLDVKVVHFKGSRKRLMLEAWNFFHSSLNIDDMLCLVLGSGRTKYDF